MITFLKDIKYPNGVIQEYFSITKLHTALESVTHIEIGGSELITLIFPNYQMYKNDSADLFGQNFASDSRLYCLSTVDKFCLEG